jgi:lipopolysaccharide export LptBFGC system permease protein LptF
MKIILTKKFTKYFLISFSIFFGILLLQFLSNYTDDIFNRGFLAVDILKLVFHTSLTLLGFCLLFGFLIASIFSFRYFSFNHATGFKKELISGSTFVIIISFLFFAYNNWILPKSNLEMRTLLYEMRSTAPGEEMKRVDKNLFKDHHSMMTIKNINLKIDTFNIKIEGIKHQCDSVLAILPDSIARENFDMLKLADYRINFKSTETSTLSERDARYAGNYLRSYQNSLKQNTEQKQKFIEEKTTRIILPIELLLLFIIGASFGFYYNDQKSFLLVILGLYTSTFFYMNERLISQNMFGDTGGVIFSMIVLITATTIFLIKGLRKEQKITQPNTRYK